MKIIGLHHIKLTVSSLEQSKEFYSKLPDFKVVAEYPDFVMFYTGSFYLGITTHNSQAIGGFDERNMGLDHVSFELESREALGEAIVFLNAQNISHGEIQNLSNDMYVLAFRDPDNIQLEFCWNSG